MGLFWGFNGLFYRKHAEECFFGFVTPPISAPPQDVSDESLEAPLGMPPLEGQGCGFPVLRLPKQFLALPQNKGEGGHKNTVEQIFPEEVKSFTALGVGVHM